jgi:hypothetical protein
MLKPKNKGKKGLMATGQTNNRTRIISKKNMASKRKAGFFIRVGLISKG